MSSDHDVLVETSNDVKWLISEWEDHKKHHKQLSYLCAAAIAAGVVSLFVAGFGV